MSRLHLATVSFPEEEILKFPPGVCFSVRGPITKVIRVTLSQREGVSNFDFLSLVDEEAPERHQRRLEVWEALPKERRDPKPPPPLESPALMYLPLDGQSVEAQRIPKGESWIAGDYIFFEVGGAWGDLLR